MYILGISCYYHDAAACLLKDGEILAASQEERFSRLKHDCSFPVNAIEFCLNYANITTKVLSYVVFYEKPFLKFERIIKTVLAVYPRSVGIFQEAIINWMKDKLWIRSLIEEKLDVAQNKILFCEHHLSHAASSFFCSPFSEAAILTVDGAGEWATTALGYGKANWNNEARNELELFDEISFPHSLGLLYSVFTAFLGFEVNEGEYKVMAMAGYGEPRYIDRIYGLVKVNNDGSFRLNMKYFSFHYSGKHAFNNKFKKLFSDCNYFDLASSIQKVTEDILIKIAGFLYQKTKLKKLCFAGGVALNCVANWRILKETPFEEIYIQPAPTDAGGALGAALYVWHCLLKKPRKFILRHAYWGKEYSQIEIKNFLERNCLKYDYIPDEERLLALVADALISQRVVGWFQGRFEWGPRALGNRSILADAREEKMKDIVNKIKTRESFRPFAPSVLMERLEDFFCINDIGKSYPLRFMLYALPLKNKALIPAVTHIDGTTRPQILDKQTNPRFYKLIERFYQKTGIAALLNTSFNRKGEPIVNSPEDAVDIFAKSSMDMLVLENFILKK